MSAKVCVLTAKGYGAISGIALYGDGAEAILTKVFVKAGGGPADFETGGIFHGQIVEDGQSLDEVVVGCEGEGYFVIHCHGNPILVQKIVQLLIRHGAQVETVEQMMWEVYPVGNNLIEREAYLEQLRAVTIEGVKIIQSQISGGLSAIVKDWLDNFDRFSIKEIQERCREILSRSIVARRIIHGVKIVLAGPANSGKSTLLNVLAGGEKAIVSDIAGTTRDWVSVFIHTGPLRAEVIDTAGLGQDAVRNAADTAAQQRTQELIKQCDCVLWIEDGTNQSQSPMNDFSVPVVKVRNKSDLPGGPLPANAADAICISAKTANGIDLLLHEIQKRLGVCDFDYSLPVVFTGRQEKLLEVIMAARQPQEIYRHLVQ
ncbi:MAG: GTP-binding protein [Planctomycetes bacterium]|nr:GTP-binding protein [Planctomycetota bacterium]